MFRTGKKGAQFMKFISLFFLLSTISGTTLACDLKNTISGVVNRGGNSASVAKVRSIPQNVINEFCDSSDGFKGMFMIRTAIRQDPIYRIIKARKNKSNIYDGVRVYQFLGDGSAHPPHGKAPQAVIDFSKPSNDFFKAKIKGQNTELRFSPGAFRFQIKATFGGVDVRENFDGDKVQLKSGKSTSFLMINTLKKSKWEWLTSSGEFLKY